MAKTQVEVVTSVERRRCWSRAEKERLVAAAIEPGAVASEIARAAGEMFSCRSCEAISQPPAPSHPIARGRAGPNLLAHVLFSKYGLHLPLNRQSAAYAREGIDLDVSTLADWVGAAAANRIDALFAVEREIKGAAPELRLAVRNERSRPLVTALQAYLREQPANRSAKGETAKAIDYSLKRWPALTRFLDDGRLCLSNNAAERALRGIAVGRHNWTFAGSDEGARRAAAVYTLIERPASNGTDPRAWLANILARLPDHPAKQIADWLPWNWRPKNLAAKAA